MIAETSSHLVRGRADDLLIAQNRALAAAAGHGPLEQALELMTRIVNEQSQDAVAAIMLVEGDRLRSCVGPGLPSDYSKAVDNLQIREGVGTCLDAAARNEVVLTPDIEQAPSWKGIAHLPLGFGFKGCWSMPIRGSDGSVLGTFGTYFREVREPTEREKQIVENLCQAAALAIERRRHESALRASEERYRALVEAVPSQCVFSIEPPVDESGVSAKLEWWRELTGQPLDDQTGFGWLDVVCPGDRERVRDAWKHALATGTVFAAEYRVGGRRGDTRYIAVRSVPIKGPSGAVREWVATLTDITEQRLVDASMRESEEGLRLALAAAKLGNWFWDAKTDVVTFGARAAEIFGIPEGPHMTWTQMQQLLHPADAPKARDAVQKSLHERADYAIEYRVRRPGDGAEVWVSARGRGLYTPSGDVTGMMGVVSDITESKRAHIALQESGQRLQGLIAQLPAAVGFVDARGKFVLQNEQMLEITGARIPSLDDQLRSRWRGIARDGTLIPPSQWPGARALRGDTTRGAEFVFTRESGEERRFLMSAVPCRNTEGVIDGAIVVAQDVTETRLAADALRESRERLRVAMEAAELGTWTYRFSDSAWDLDEVAQRLYRTPSTRVLHDEAMVRQLLHPDDIPPMWEAVRRACDPAGDGRYACEYRITQEDGSAHWLAAWARVEFEGEGPSRRAVRMVGASRDITERKAGEEALRASENRLRQLADAMPALVSRLDEGLIYRFVNQAYSDWFGLPQDQMVGRHIRDVVGESTYAIIGERLERALAGERVEYEATLPYRHGGQRYVLATYLPDRAPDGTICGVYVMVHDISERRRAEERVAASEREFRAIFELAAAGKAQAELGGGRFTRVNRKFCEITGYAEAELLQMTFRDITHPDDLSADLAAIARAHRGETEGWRSEKRYIRKNEEIVWVVVAGNIIRDERGNPLRTVATIHDITARKEAEEALQQAQGVLLERTADLERANRELQRFVSIASHDLKEPLRGVAHLSSFVLEDEPGLSEAARSRLQRIGSLCARLTEMVNGLLDYARSGGERHNEPCDLGEIARRAADKLAETLGQQHAEVTIAEGLPWVAGDPMLLERVFANLLANALKYNRAEIKRIEIGLEDGAVFVRDNGIGIEERHHEKIFGLFSRISGGEVTQGVGLGLALVKNIVESHGGRVWLRSAPGEGSTFYLRIPTLSSPLPQPV